MTESQTPATSQAPATSQTPQPILKPHTNTVVPHAIADYDTDLVQLNVWTGTKWINVFDGNDFKNMNIDLNRVAKVVEDQVVEIEKAVKQANDAMDQANQAVDDSNVNKTAISDVEKAANEAKQNIADALKKVTDLGTQVNKNQTDIEQTKDSISLKADQTTVDDINKQVTQNEATLSTLSDEIKLKVDSTTVNEIVDGKGYTTAETAQALIDQTADKISSTITNLKTTVDNNGKAISTTNDQVSNLTQTIDGLQVTIKNKADQSQITQLSNQITEKVSTKDYQTEIGLLQDDLNLRISKGDVISQLNLEAGGDGLIQVANGKGKLLLDADSVVFGNKAFIPSAAITDIQADQITSGTLDAGNVQIINLTADHIKGGTLDVGNMNIRNFSANDIEAGTLSGVTIKVGDNNSFFQTSGDSIIWKKADDSNSSSVIGTSTYSENKGHLGLTIADSDHVQISTWPGAYVENGKIIQPGGYIGHPRIMVENSGMHWDPDKGSYSAINNVSDNANRVLNWVDTSEYFWVTEGKGALVHLNESLPGSQFTIQKNNKVGAYFGTGDEGNRTEITSFGGFNLMNTGIYSEDPKVTSTISNLVVDNLHVKTWFGDDGYKHATVKTSQGLIGVNAYETAEYYFGDIGENNTGNTSQVVIGIDRIFNETVNTDIQYQVFVTPYSDAHVWVEERYNNRFVICSDKPDAEFGWEIKAKRKGYERTRLQNFDNVMPQVKRSK